MADILASDMADTVQKDDVDIAKQPEQSSQVRIVPVDGVSDETFPSSIEKLSCPICRRRMFTRSNGILRLRTRILVFERAYAVAKCRHCRNDVVVPIVMCEAFDRESLPIWHEELDGKT